MLGTIEGSAGGITFASRGGINVMRQKVGKNSSNTPAQQAQRSKFGELGRLARKLGAILPNGFKTVGGQSGYNRFMAVNAVAVGLDANQLPVTDYGLLEISAGSITPLSGLAVGALALGKTVSWTNNSDGNGALPSDSVYVAIVNKLTGEVATSLGAATRAEGTLDVPAPFLINVAADDLAVYAFAKRALTNEASNTARLASGTGTGGTSSAGSYTTSLAGPSNEAQGVTLAASAGDTLRFNALTTGGSAPASMDINVGGQQVASVAYLDRYTGKPFSFTHAGVTRTGNFAPTVNF